MTEASRKKSVRKYYLAHKDEINERRRQKYKRDSDYRTAIRASDRKYVEGHRCGVNENRRAKYKSNETVRLARRGSNYKYRAGKFGVAHEPYQSNYIFERDNWTCQICGRKINKRLKHPNLLRASIDHIVPLSKGGGDNPLNVQASHLRCNLGKNATSIGQLRLFG